MLPPSSRGRVIRVVVVGAGAIGAFVGAALAKGQSDVVLVARGPHLAALQTRGLTIQTANGEFRTRLPATDDIGAVVDADVVFLSVKAHAIRPLAERLTDWMGNETSLICAQNGIPWWYFQDHPGAFANQAIQSVDPEGQLLQLITAECIIGCATYCSTELVEPGVVRHVEGNRFVIGEPGGQLSDRCRRIANAFDEGGLKCSVSRDIRTQIWLKVVGNVAFNPVSALTRSTLSEMGESTSLRLVLRSIMEEASQVAAALGITLPVSLDQRLEGGFAVGEHKTSMLQDLEAGRHLELDCLTAAVAELAELVDVAIPYTRTIDACTRMLAQHSV